MKARSRQIMQSLKTEITEKRSFRRKISTRRRLKVLRDGKHKFHTFTLSLTHNIIYSRVAIFKDYYNLILNIMIWGWQMPTSLWYFSGSVLAYFSGVDLS